MTIPRKWRWGLRAIDFWHGLRRKPAPGGPHRFVVVCAARSGSTWLIDLLDSHRQVCCFPDLFAHDHYGEAPDGGSRQAVTWDSYSVNRIGSLGWRARMQLFFRYLDDEVYGRGGDAPWVGFRLMYYQLQRGFGLPAYLKVRGVSILHLIRHNHLDVILSHEAIKNRKYYHASQQADVAPLQIQLEASTLLQRLQERDSEIREQRRFYASLGLPCHEISYEALCADRDAHLREAFDFLGLPPGDEVLHSPLKKLNPRNRRELIANYDEIEDVLSGSPFASLLSKTR